MTYLDKCVRHFVQRVLCGRWDRDGRLHVQFDSGIREYEGNVYVASVGTGATLHWETRVFLEHKPIQDVAKYFYDQSRNPIFRRTVFGHKRFIRGDAPLYGTTHWQSRFKLSRHSYEGLDYDWISVADTDIWLPDHQQLKMVIDHNCTNDNINFRRLIIVFTTLINTTMQNLLVEYVYAILAVLHRLPTRAQKSLYLTHQRTYLLSMSTVEYSMDEINVPDIRHQILQDAIHRIDTLFDVLSESINVHGFNGGHPNAQQLQAARALGLSVAQWFIGTYQQLAAFHGQPRLAEIRVEHSLRYMEQISRVWVALGSTLYPTLRLEYMEPEYALYAHRVRVWVEELQQEAEGPVNLPDLSSAVAVLPSPKIY
ncbi:hypothetical protein C8R46DRAFT_1114962 [Mycena filopes]|nr:hypothetical protein C8R46DRAFT_1114962 [Mycena filopes]